MLRGINRSKVWVFIICLLIITVNVLVITGYVQIKYNKILCTKNNISSNEEENILNENRELRNTVNSLRADLDKQKKETTQAEQKYKYLRENDADVINMYEDIIKAEILRKNGDYAGAADSLKSVNRDYLLPSASELDYQIRSDVSKPAAAYFYNTGLEHFSKSDYDEAILLFKKSLFFINDESFKEDCQFYLGKSNYLAGNRDAAKKSFEQFIDEFPYSRYTDEVAKMYEELK